MKLHKAMQVMEKHKNENPLLSGTLKRLADTAKSHLNQDDKSISELSSGSQRTQSMVSSLSKFQQVQLQIK